MHRPSWLTLRNRPSWLTLRNAAIVLAQLAVAVAVTFGAWRSAMGESGPCAAWLIVWPVIPAAMLLRVVLPESYVAQYDPVGPPAAWIFGFLVNVVYVFGLIRAIVWVYRRVNRRSLTPNASKIPLVRPLP